MDKKSLLAHINKNNEKIILKMKEAAEQREMDPKLAEAIRNLKKIPVK